MIVSLTVLGLLLTVVAAIAVALRSLFVRLGTETNRVTDAIFVMMLLNLALVVPTTIVVHYPSYSVSPAAFAAFIGAGLVGPIIGRLCHFEGIRTIGASRADPIKSSQPLYATALAVVFLGETVTGFHLAGILLIMIGIVALSAASRRSDHSNEIDGTVTAGILAALLAAFFYALYPVIVRYGLQQGTPLLIGLSATSMSSTVGFSLYLRSRGTLPSLVRIRSRWFLAAGLANTAFLFAYYGALEIAPVVIVLPILQVSPLFVIAISFLFMPKRLEYVTWRVAVTSGLVVLGAIVVSLSG